MGVTNSLRSLDVTNSAFLVILVHVRATLFGAYSPWLLPLAVYLLARLKYSHPYIGYLVSAVVALLFVDLLVNPQIFKDTFLHDSLFHGSWFNPNVASVALAIFTFLIPTTFTLEISKTKAITFSSRYLDLLVFIVVILSASIIGLFVFALSLFSRYRQYLFGKKVFSLISVLAAAIFLYLNLEHISKSFEVRFSIWRSALRMLENNLVFGIGPGNFKHFFLEYREDKLTILKEKDLIQVDPHNLILNSLLSFGLFATLLLAALFITILATQLKFFRNEISVGILIFTFFAQSMINVNSVFVNSVFAFTYVVMKTRTDQMESR
jgi:O-antigen ligase